MSRHKLIGLSVIVIAGVCFIGAIARSQDKKPGAGAAPGGGDMDAMMKTMQDASAVGPHHKGLEAMAGKFKYVNKFRMDPNQDWQTSEGDYSGQMGLGGRYLLQSVNGPMMGMQFEGMGCLGYDNVLQKHVAAWIDSMGTGIMRSEGTCDGACKNITFEGEMMDPMTKKMAKYKYSFEVKSNDEFVMHWWSPSMSDGKMFEMMTIDYTRVK
jgi:hypothetical protein